ncbi:hypothetical protein LTR56_006862 [Elasticomyces elasticus]|nr:hypothetical protein LTR22_016695 [Elasticomyces elasticus]KAK3649386.1 hypothetical protein LTR56_006862 [Elasticomyces elasticus]KAK4903799.1 hypothetical protein LTR49_026645 [Elasticomyces elasticus]KAK5748297.1 hypothetical protein LTS12_021636 [Elasticomyces elasticus]
MAKRAGEDGGAVQKKKRKTPQRKVKTITASTGKCMLPTIAPELRNKIYEMVLLEDGTVRIDKKLRVPALLQVCRQIRSDTLVMWYERNYFALTVMHCDADVLLRWGQHIRTTLLGSLERVVTSVDLRGKPNWSNLMRWCKIVCANGGVWFLEVPGNSKLAHVVKAATTMACRFRTNRRRWSECEEALEEFRLAVGRFDPRWLD